MFNRRRTLSVVVATSLSTVAAAVVAVGAVSTDEGSKPPVAQTPVSGIDERVEQEFEIFRTAETAKAEAAPNDVATSAAGANPALSVPAGPPGAELYATPGRDRICLSSPNLSSCAGTGVALSGGFFTLDVCSPGVPPGKVRLAGLAPDDVKRFAVRLQDGRSVEVPLVDNGWTVDVDALPTQVTWSDASGDHGAPTPTGLKSLDECINVP